MLERDIKRAINRYLDKFDCFHFHYSSYMGYAGIPDIIVVSKYNPTVFIEVKLPGCKPTPIQMAVHKKLWLHGAVVIVVHSLEETKNALIEHQVILNKKTQE